VDPEEAALWWATRRQVDPVRFAADQGFAVWLADPENEAAWHEIDRRVENIGAYATMPEIRKMRRAALERLRPAAEPRWPIWIAAATLAASLLLALNWVAAPVGGGVRPAEIARGDAARRFATRLGERRDLVLEDGSRVTLNTASILEARYSPERREVALLQGQALFHVAHNPDRPFVVLAGNRRITAVGTAFDVRVRQNGQVDLMLVEGRVRVEPVARHGMARIIPALDETELEAGEQLVAVGDGDPIVTVGDVERVTAWNRGILVFRNDSVGEAVREVNRYSAVQLVVDDPRVAGLRISGVFPTARREDFVAALETLYPVAAEQEAAGIVRIRWRARQ
jgi:transmembrane sensor